MNILHYGLGFPPYRSGGMTKYCVDLMISQKEEGHKVAMIWPGQITIVRNRDVLIKKRKSNNGIGSYEIINPLPIPYDEGIQDIDRFMVDRGQAVYRKFFKEHQIDYLIVHTLMGMHKTFLEVAHENNIKICYVSHDYFGVCPKVTLFHNGQPCTDNSDCSKCVACNKDALSFNKMFLLQQPLYRFLKDSVVVKKLRRMHRSKEVYSSELISESVIKDDAKAQQYLTLRNHYIEMLKCMDKVFYNSTVAKEQYEQFFSPNSSQLIHITHRNLVDCRQSKGFDKTLKIVYLAPLKQFKGFELLMQVVERLYQSGRKDFRLAIYGNYSQNREYLTVKDGYTYEDMKDIFQEADVLVAPSIWNETFGFTVAEAIYAGVPVIVSDRVGAKDLVRDGWNGRIISPDEECFYQSLVQIYDDRELLKQFHLNILSMDLPTDDLIEIESVMAVEKGNIS